LIVSGGGVGMDVTSLRHVERFTAGGTPLYPFSVFLLLFICIAMHEA
jgi:hypothetical protein